MESDIGAELATLDKVLELSNTSKLMAGSLLAESTPLTSRKRKHEEASPGYAQSNEEETFRAEVDRVFAEFNVTLLKIYDKYDKSACARMNATKRLCCLQWNLHQSFSGLPN